MNEDTALEQTISTPLTKPKLLLVEGRDDEGLFSALITHLGGMPEIEIRKYFGKDNFRQFIRALLLVSGFGNVNSIGVIRDADNNADGAFQSVKDSLLSVGLPAPNQPLQNSTGMPTTTIAILPIDQQQGELEDVLLSSVDTDPAIFCVNDYITCLEDRGLTLPNKLSKARLHTFLASREEPNLLIGQAARAGYFGWEASSFVSVIQFLQAL